MTERPRQTPKHKAATIAAVHLRLDGPLEAVYSQHDELYSRLHRRGFYWNSYLRLWKKGDWQISSNAEYLILSIKGNSTVDVQARLSSAFAEYHIFEVFTVESHAYLLVRKAV